MAPSLESLFDRNNSYPIYVALCRIIPLRSLLALSRTSRFFRRSIRAQWDIDQTLRRFVSNPKRFRSQLGEYDALVSGSVALQFFERVVWPESDLDIFIPEKHLHTFANYLVNEEQYTEPEATELSGREEYIMDFLSSIHNLYRSGTKIQLIGVRKFPLQAILQGFYITTIINFISWNKAYSIFPRTTFLQHKGYLLQRMDDYFAMLIQKYSRRGWRFQELLWEEEATSTNPIQSRRRIGDCYSWVMSLDTTAIMPPKTPDTALLYSEFEMCAYFEPYANKIKCDDFRVPVLRGKYTCASSSASCLLPLRERLRSLTRIEILKLRPHERQLYFNHDLDSFIIRPDDSRSDIVLQLPDDWNYYDDEIPGWYDRLEKKLPPPSQMTFIS